VSLSRNAAIVFTADETTDRRLPPTTADARWCNTSVSNRASAWAFDDVVVGLFGVLVALRRVSEKIRSNPQTTALPRRHQSLGRNRPTAPAHDPPAQLCVADRTSDVAFGGESS
jgi:hypothetical protein